ncbi:RnfABCDGE type electron transport complex subunit D [uncultured Ilyobacter sp.]|uniref:RnfABCDGE type electron transport complex subunit D n=1 Tax=uncultured Ilyobacter sp. TaxID=544433 RepID=UPI0029C67199|nr:RnfABCDGE type electron transport complex subunit D [uncultured Ilyobacter sp.]
MYKVTESPHVRIKDTLEWVMWDVVIALLPCILSAVYYFGLKAIGIIAVSVSAGLATEAVMAKTMDKSWKCIFDGSGLVATLLLALIIPHTVPLWMVAMGSVFGIGIGKMAYGGVGQNIFNPALVGRIFMMVSFPRYLFSFYTPDGVAAPTIFPLIKYRGLNWVTESMGGRLEFYKALLVGKDILGSIGETNKAAILIGFLYLGFRKRLKWRVPILVVASKGLLSYFYGADPVLSMLGGGLFFGAVYMCTDMVSGPVTERGKGVFAVLVGTLAFFIANYTSHPAGIGYAILLGNLVTPLINRYTEPRVYGKDRDMKKIYGILSVLILFIIGISILGSVEKISEKRNEVRKNKQMEEMKSYIFQKNLRFQDEDGIFHEGYIFIPAYDEEGGKYYLVLGETKGYGSKMIKFALGITPDRNIAGVSILEESETEGLGAAIRDKKWLEHWRGMDSGHQFNKEIDAAAGATYTYKNIHKIFMDILDSSKVLTEKGSYQDDETDGYGGATDSDWEDGAEDGGEYDEKSEETDSQAGASPEWNEGEEK